MTKKGEGQRNKSVNMSRKTGALNHWICF